jgi:hypothetical protein
MSKKRKPEKSKVAVETLSPEELQELEMIIDRLQVQDPEGESLPNCLESLRTALSSRETLASALMENIGRNPSDVGFQVFLAFRDLFQSKDYKRLIKQTAYRFTQKGYAEEQKAEAEVERQVTLVRKEERKAAAHIVPGVRDVFGLMAVLLPEERIAGPSAIPVFLECPLLLADVSVAEGTQRIYKEMVREASEAFGGAKPYEVPVWHAARLFFDAVQFSGKRGLPSNIESVKLLLKPFYDPQRAPYAYELMPPVDNPGVDLDDADVHALIKAIPFNGLIFPQNDLLPFFQKIENLGHSTLVVSQDIKQDRVTDILKEAADSICTGEVKTSYERFFEEMALRFKLTGKEDLAQFAWITAQHLRSVSRVSENLFIMHLVTSSMARHWPELSPPPERRQQQEEEPYERLESGLIIPR